jgi:DNA ligase-1
MKDYARLLDALLYTTSRNAKVRLLTDYFRHAPDPDRGWGLAAITHELDIPSVKPGLIRDLIAARTDPVLFDYSYDYVGDLAETVSLLWPGDGQGGATPTLDEIVNTLRLVGREEAAMLVAGWLDRFDTTERWAFLKLVTGAPRVGVSSRMAKMAVAALGDVPVDDVEEVWHGLKPPYAGLFAWACGAGERPSTGDRLVFRPLMLATPLDEGDLEKLAAADYLAEWKWDGIRVQLAARGGEARLFSRTGDDISDAFPDVVEAAAFDAVIDGELLVGRDGDPFDPAPFNDLQQRLNRKAVSKAMLRKHPAFVRAYDLLMVDGEDLRALPFAERRERLERWLAARKPPRLDLSPVLDFDSWDAARTLRADAPPVVEGLMLKRADSVYVPGRPKGPWFKWKRDPFTIDCVVMYAQRGHGKRSSFFSDYTFGLWRAADEGADELVPVGKAYFGFTDEELKQLDAWVREHAEARFGPVTQVEPSLVVEVAFDAVQRSTRHKSGVAMRFPRFHRIRWDKPGDEADRLETLEALIEAG